MGSSKSTSPRFTALSLPVRSRLGDASADMMARRCWSAQVEYFQLSMMHGLMFDGMTDRGPNNWSKLGSLEFIKSLGRHAGTIGCHAWSQRTKSSLMRKNWAARECCTCCNLIVQRTGNLSQ